MKLDIVICTYNRSEKLRKTLQSILDAHMPKNIIAQLFVVNNASKDNTEGVIKEFINEHGEKIKYLFEERQGKSFALNTALKHTTGNFIAFTDDDVVVDKNWMKEMIKAFKKYPKNNCFGGKVIAIYPKDIPKWLDIHGSMRFLKSVFVDRDDGDFEVEYGADIFTKMPCGVNMFFRREAIEKNSIFRTDLGPIGKELGFSEDAEYCQRLTEKGEKFMYIPSAIVYHPVHKERLNKKYPLKWQYRCGASEVRRNGGYKDMAETFGVPKYLFGKFIRHTAGWWLSFQVRKRFYHKLRLYYTAGEIVEYFRINLKKTVISKRS